MNWEGSAGWDILKSDLVYFRLFAAMARKFLQPPKVPENRQ